MSKQETIGDVSYVVTEDGMGMRLDVFLAQALQSTRNKVQNLIGSGSVFVDKECVTKTGYMVKLGNTIVIHPPTIEEKTRVFDKEEETKELLTHIEIIADTDTYVVINKPAGILVHPTDAGEPYTVVTWLLEQYPHIHNVGENPRRPGIVHRLDKDASGLLVVAKTQEMFVYLKSQFQQRHIEKIYTVLVHGVIAKDEDTLTFPIDRGENGKMVSRPKPAETIDLSNAYTLQKGKDAETSFWVEERFLHHTLLKVEIKTGRTHQIRVHMHAYRHPVVGDTLYTQKQYTYKSQVPLHRLFLHATTLQFIPLGGGAPVRFEAPLPAALSAYMQKLQPISF
ncbi:MAG: RluA family pseudouridine synthase [Candidatus Magasanikbacteria bacterium]|nr:RluA family pseudouridine synthase [Candidatus Magasanikbacteria bacterium]